MGKIRIESNTTKRKRLDARSYHNYVMASVKKHRSTVINETAPERRDEMLHDLSHSMQIRADSEVELQPNNGDSVLEQYGSVAQLNSDKVMPEVEFGAESKKQCPSLCEYWVPVGFCHLQLEKYCEILIENSSLLCSPVKRNVLDAPHEVLTTIRTCCDHPYLVDGSLEKHVNAGRQTVDYLTTGIEASGKLVLLDKILQDAKQKQSRVLIVFQSKHSKSQLTVRYILDDFIRQRFGEESYVHIYQEFDNSKRRAALDLFNNKDSKRFVILIEKNSCNSNIILSSMDFVILFNSDWSPISDLKSLQKMTIQSKYEKVKVLRLYSTHSVEEKSLVLAKRGNVLCSTTVSFSHNLCHTLLLWGASYLFKRLDEFHSVDSHGLCEHGDVYYDLSELLFCEEGHGNCSPLISKISDPIRGYSEALSLCGEKDVSPIDEGIPHNFVWSSLLEGKKPRWKLLPKSSTRTRRKVDNVACNSERKTQNPLENPKGFHSECEPSEGVKPHDNSLSPISEQNAGNPNSGDNIVESCPWWSRLSIKDVEGICSRMMHKLLVDQIRRVNVFTRTKRERKARLKQKHHPLNSQRYREPGLKQQCNLHLASIKKVKQWEDLSVSFLMKKNLNKPVSSLALTQSFNSELGSEISDIVTESVYALSETEKDMLDVSASPPDTSPTATEVLSVQQSETQHSNKTEVLFLESDGEDDAASIPAVAPPNEVSENGASTSAASHCEKKSGSNREIEGSGSINTEPFDDVSDQLLSEETLRGVVGFSESDGENDVSDYANTEPFNDVSDIPDIEGSVGAPSREDSASPGLPTSSCVLEKIAACSTSGLALPSEKGVTVTDKEHDRSDPDHHSNILHTVSVNRSAGCSDENDQQVMRDTASTNLSDNEAQNVDKELCDEASKSETKGRDDATNLNTTYRQPNVENPPGLPSSTLVSGSCGEAQVQTGAICGNLSPSDLSVCSANQITQTPARLAVPSCEIPRTSLLCLPSQSREQLVDLGSQECPTIQTYTITSSPVSLVDNYFPGNSSTSSDSPSLIGSISLLNELARMEKEKENVSNSYETEMKSLRSACEKEIEEICKKYDLLLKDAENVFLMKKQALESLKEKIHLHKLLADVFRDCQKLEPTRVLLDTLHPPSILLNHTSEQNILANAQHLAQPLQVHQLSDLFAVDQTRPQIRSVTDDTGNRLGRYPTQVQSPHLRSSLLPMHSLPTPSHGMQNQLSHVRQLQGSTCFYGLENHPFLASPQSPRSMSPFHGMQSQQILAPPRPQGSRPLVGPCSQQILAPSQPQGSRPFVGPHSRQILAFTQPQGSRPFVGPQSLQILAPMQSQGSLPGLCQRGYAPEHLVQPGGSQYDPVHLS